MEGHMMKSLWPMINYDGLKARCSLPTYQEAYHVQWLKTITLIWETEKVEWLHKIKDF